MPKDSDIHKAAYKGDLGKIKELLEDGTDINLMGAGNRTALHRAVGECHENVVDFLISQKADLNAKDSNGRTPLHWAAVSNSLASGKLLVASGGVDLNVQTKTGSAPIHMAIENNHPDFAIYLIGVGVDITIEDFTPLKPKTALMLAKEKKMIEVEKLLRPNSAGCCSVM